MKKIMIPGIVLAVALAITPVFAFASPKASAEPLDTFATTPSVRAATQICTTAADCTQMCRQGYVDSNGDGICDNYSQENRKGGYACTADDAPCYREDCPIHGSGAYGNYCTPDRACNNPASGTYGRGHHGPGHGHCR